MTYGNSAYGQHSMHSRQFLFETVIKGGYKIGIRVRHTTHGERNIVAGFLVVLGEVDLDILAEPTRVVVTGRLRIS